MLLYCQVFYLEGSNFGRKCFNKRRYLKYNDLGNAAFKIEISINVFRYNFLFSLVFCQFDWYFEKVNPRLS